MSAKGYLYARLWSAFVVGLMSWWSPDMTWLWVSSGMAAFAGWSYYESTQD